jgi:hypothetical protein
MKGDTKRSVEQETNDNAMTWREWHEAVGFYPASRESEFMTAWRTDQDPADWKGRYKAPPKKKRSSVTNNEGLTWPEWRDAAGVARSTSEYRTSWRLGIDPSEIRKLTAMQRGHPPTERKVERVGPLLPDPVPYVPQNPDNYYNVTIRGVKMDPYRVAGLIGLKDHALFHAWKKIGWSGSRSGKKTQRQDVEEAIAALNRWCDMQDEDIKTDAG